jgi:hypothetical protein
MKELKLPEGAVLIDMIQNLGEVYSDFIVQASKFLFCLFSCKLIFKYLYSYEQRRTLQN